MEGKTWSRITSQGFGTTKVLANWAVESRRRNFPGRREHSPRLVGTPNPHGHSSCSFHFGGRSLPVCRLSPFSPLFSLRWLSLHRSFSPLSPPLPFLFSFHLDGWRSLHPNSLCSALAVWGRGRGRGWSLTCLGAQSSALRVHRRSASRSCPLHGQEGGGPPPAPRQEVRAGRLEPGRVGSGLLTPVCEVDEESRPT